MYGILHLQVESALPKDGAKVSDVNMSIANLMLPNYWYPYKGLTT